MNRFIFLVVLNFLMVASSSFAEQNTTQKAKKKKKVVLITGASSGIGRCTALALHKRGYIVYAAARRVNKMEDLREKGIHIIKLDVTNEKLRCACVAEIIRNEGRIDILINNAGIGVYGSVEETTIEDAKYQFDVNLFGLGRLIQLILPYMRKQKSGTIVNVSSVLGKTYMPLGSWYVASKHALEGWSDCLRTEVKSFGINVIIIEPGMIRTEFGDVIYQPMVKRSGEGAYKKFVRKIKRYMDKKKKKENQTIGSSPSVIALTIVKALQKRKPATRYAAGKYARFLLFLRRWFSDKFLDWLILAQFK